MGIFESIRAYVYILSLEKLCIHEYYSFKICMYVFMYAYLKINPQPFLSLKHLSYP